MKLNSYIAWVGSLESRLDSMNIVAMDPEEAAALYMEIHEQRQAEFQVGCGDEDRLVYIEDDDRKITLTKVSGEVRAVYSAVTMMESTCSMSIE